MTYYVENGKVKEVTASLRSDPFRESFTEYAKKADAEIVAKVGDEAAAHVRSQKKLGMSDVEFGRYASGFPLDDADAEAYTRKARGE